MPLSVVTFENVGPASLAVLANPTSTHPWAINPLFPALRSGPTARSGAYPKSKFLAASSGGHMLTTFWGARSSVQSNMKSARSAE